MVDKLFFRGEPITLRCFFKNLPILCPIPIGPLFYQGFYTKDGLDFPLARGHRSVRPTRLGPSGLIFYFYPLHRPTLIIAIFDTETAATIIHPKILPEEFRLPHYQMIHAANGETFTITKKKKKKKKKKQTHTHQNFPNPHHKTSSPWITSHW